jgi:hydroxymethylbilane synthase
MKILLGTRGSELALAQTRLVEEAIRAKQPDITIEKRIIATTGDGAKVVDVKAGWKGVFTAEIERALMAGDVDVAVHSAKDLPSEMHRGAEIAAALRRAAPGDVLISKGAAGLAGLAKGATVATSSVRRKHQLRWRRPDLKIVDLRGNVPTRLRKLAENDWGSIVLARAGLDRLDASLDFFVEDLPAEIFLPAGGQGIVVLQIRGDDGPTKAVVELVNHCETLLCLQAERSFLRLLNVDCNAPVGVLATIEKGQMKMLGQFFDGDSAAPRQAEVEGEVDGGARLARELASRLRI